MEIHIARDGQQYGPFSPDDVRRQLAAGTLLPTDFAWAEGAVDWVPLSSLPVLATPVKSPLATARLPVIGLRPPPVADTADPGAPRTSGAAVASLICGVLSVSFLPIFLTAVAAVVCGHVARGGIRRAEGGSRTGEGMALAGLVTGYCGIALSIFAAIVIVVAIFISPAAVPIIGEWQLRGKETKSMANARLIATSCHLYAADHHGVFPKALDELVPKYLPDRSTLVCPLSPDLPVGYEYFGGMDTDPADKILLMSKFADPKGKRIVAHVDSSCVLQVPPP